MLETKSHFRFGSNGTMACGQVALDEQSLAIFVIHIDAHPVVQIQVNKNNSKVDIYYPMFKHGIWIVGGS